MLAAGCNFAPKYSRPTTELPAAFKEAALTNAPDTNLWKSARPQDGVLRQRWWEMYNDPQLSELERQASLSNQTVIQAYANLRVARALTREAWSQFFPTLTTSPGVTRESFPSSSARIGVVSGTSGAGVPTVGATATTGSTTTGATTTGTSGSSSSPFTLYSLPFDASWVPDLWGRVKNTVRASRYGAQASAADLENTRLTVQAEVAVDYFELRAQDALIDVLDSTVAADQKSLELTQVLFTNGINSELNIVQARTTLETTLAQASGLRVARAQFEHAIAVLIGKPPAMFSLAVAPFKTQPPAIPMSLPSQLLERRPDIAAAERLVAQANAQIGVAKAAYFPTLTLTGSAGFESTEVVNLIGLPNGFWSVGGALAETIFDAGLRKATVAQDWANYDSVVAQYRQTVLTAFQQVEDNLAALRIFGHQINQQQTAVTASEQNLSLSTHLFGTGVNSYLNVITAQTTLLGNRETLLSIQLQLMTASVQLIEALGGGWDAARLPKD